jgi:hypothetical protein
MISPSTKVFNLSFGPVVPTIHEQLRMQDIRHDVEAMAEFQFSADCISRLNVHGLLTDTEARTARKRLFKKIRRSLEKLP